MKLQLSWMFFGLLFLTYNAVAYGQGEIGKQNINTQVTPNSPTISDLTRTRLIKNDGYSNEEIATLKTSNPRRLAYLDYYYSKSFRVKAGQDYTQEQLLLVNISNLYQYRLENETKEIYDTESHLFLILDAKNTVKATNKEIMYPNGKFNSANKYR